MSRKIIDVGLKGNDGTGDPIREAFRKINDNFTELYTSLGLVQGFTILSLSDTPNTYVGNSKALLSVNNDGNATVFKQFVAGPGINIDFDTNPNEINLSASFADIVVDQSPQLGGDLSARSGGVQYRIVDLGTDLQPMVPLSKWEAVNKNYADGKVSLAGVDTQEYVGLDNLGNPIIQTNSTRGVMTGPLVLSRDPVTEDDELWEGKTAATKRYVDGASYFSRINLHVSVNGNDARADITDEKQGRALAYSYRTIEAACKRAEELIDSAPLELGPYGKVLTFNNGAGFSTLTSISTSVDSGIGCTASPIMSVNGYTIVNTGSFYKIGDLLTIDGGIGTDPAVFEVTEVSEGTGALIKVKLLKSGVYTSISGIAVNAPTTTNSTFGSNAHFDLTYRVSAIAIDTPGSGYGLASVRIIGGGGSGAFGFVDVVNGEVISATVTEQGSGFTSSPEVRVELPTFRIDTGGYGTDFTKTPGPNRDIREGLYLRGETSGALANILSHNGTLDGNDELFDVDIVSGSFINGERIAYGDAVKNLHITVFVESGIYEENYPIKLPANVSIKGDEFRRTIIRPRTGMSTSPFAYVKFRRDTVIDGLTIATQPFGYHYLTDSREPIYPTINNKGGFRSATQILKSNKAFIQAEVIGWIAAQVQVGNYPFTGSFTYNETLCKRDVGLIIDAIAYDLRWGGQNRTISAALKYYQNASSLIAITDQLLESVAAMNYIRYLALQCLDGLPPGIVYGNADQVIDPAYVAEVGTPAIFESLLDAIIDIVSDNTSFNAPKDNTEMDVFLCNDAVILRNLTIQGHGGFAMVLDPTGQILTKSPYAQIGTVFSGSTGRHRFAGGLFIDGFAGNVEFRPVSRDGDYLLNVDNLVRKPPTPFSFQVDGVNYRVNYIRNYIFDPAGSSATFVLDETTPFSLPIFTYNETNCYRDVGLILNGVGYDTVLGGNYHARKSGFSYRQVAAAAVIADQLDITLSAIGYAHDQASALLVGNTTALAGVAAHKATILDIIQNNTTPALSLPAPSGLSTAKGHARTLLLANTAFIKAETTGWIDAQIAANAVNFAGLTYTKATCARDVEYILNAVTYDLIYGGNSQSVDAGLKYFDGLGTLELLQVPTNQRAASAAAIDYAKYLAKQVSQNLAPAVTYSATPRVPGTASDSATALLIDGLYANVSAIITGGIGVAPAITYPDLTAYPYSIDAKAGRTIIIANTTKLQSRTIDFVNSEIGYQAITAGNRSMLSNDFTQVCDMGYGILATNGGLTEAVGMFTYYCYTAFYALNGAQIRSVGGSCSNGVYALKSEGSDPLEVPITGQLLNNVTQGAKVYAPGGTQYENQPGDLSIYVNNYNYIPYNQCQLEIDHSGVVTNYSIVNVDSGGALPAGVIKLNLSTAASSGIFSGGLVAAVANGADVTIRLNNQVRLYNISEVFGTRPSTALIFNETPDFIYRVTTLSTAGLGANQAQATLREPYQYADVKVWSGGAQPASHGGVGNTQIAVDEIASASVIARLVGLQFGWKGAVHTVTGYDKPSVTGFAWGRLRFTTALTYTVGGFASTPTLRLGAQAGLQGNVTVKISTARFTGHDLLDIGTGSYADTNYPSVIYGDPANAASQENEVLEIGKGRVFYVTTDQDGNFRVGPFFSIDQGSGTVSFTADLALNNLDGLGFKRGVTIAEFSTDDTMSDNASDTVPTESAVRAYIDHRLGVTHNGGTVTAANLIPFSTGGFLALNGQLPMKGSIDMNVTNRINNLADPANAQDAVTKSWTKLSNLQDGTLTGVANQDLLMLTGTAGAFVNVANNTAAITNTSTSRGGGSDISIVRSGNTLTTKLIGGQGTANPVTNYHINDNADIAQSKLLMTIAGERAAAPTGTAKQKQAASGLASFKDIEFTVTDGFVEFQTASSTTTGVLNSKLQWIAGRTVMGNSTVSNGAVSQVLMTDVIDLGGAIKKSLYSTTGYLRRTGVANTNDTDYSVVEEAVAATANTLVKRDSNGDFQARTITVANLYVDNKIAVDTEALTGTDTGVIKVYAYRGSGGILLGDGATVADKVNFYDNELHRFRTLTGFKGTIEVGTLTTGAVGTAGTLTGAWSLSTTSNLTLGTGTIDASTGTLKSLTLTTGSVGTAGSLTGAWTVKGSSSLTLESGGKFDASSGTLQSTTLSAGAAGTLATITGAWSLNSGSTLSPGNGTISATKTANVTLTATNSATSTHYITFASAQTGDQVINTDSGLTYNPSTNTLTASTFVGGLTGNADTVTNGVYSNSTQSITGAKTFTVDTTFQAATMWNVGATAARQRADARADATTFSRLHWYGTDNAGATSNFRHAYYDGSSYINVTAAAGVLTFTGEVTATKFNGNVNGVASSVTSQANSATITAATANTASTIVLRDASGNFSAGVMTGTATTARYADLAERYKADKEYKPGTVVVFGGEFEITQSTKLLDTRVAGVISTNPAHLMNSEAGDDITHPPVALQGRVPCRVVGKVQKGDLLVTSSIPGVAIATTEPKIGTVIGKALENYNDDHIGVIEVVVGRA